MYRCHPELTYTYYQIYTHIEKVTNQYFVTDSSEDTGREIVESQWAILAQLHELILAEQRQRLALQQLVALTTYKYGVKFVDNNIVG